MIRFDDKARPWEREGKKFRYIKGITSTKNDLKNFEIVTLVKNTGEKSCLFATANNNEVFIEWKMLENLEHLEDRKYNKIEYGSSFLVLIPDHSPYDYYEEITFVRRDQNNNCFFRRQNGEIYLTNWFRLSPVFIIGKLD
jgi:hypothetical protein